MIKSSVLALLLILQVYAHAQYFKPKNYVSFTELNFNSGVASYVGELNDYTSLQQALNTRYSLQLELYRPLNRNLGIACGFGFTKLSGDDFYSTDLFSYSRNLQFSSDLLSAEATLSYDLGRQSLFKRNRSQKELRVFSGLGFAHFNSKTILANGSKVTLNGLSTEGQGLNPLYPDPYPNYFAYIPLGFRYSLRVGTRSLVGLTFKYNITFSDYIDDVSGIYPNPLLLNSDISREVSNRASENNHAKTGKDRIAKLTDLVSSKSTFLTYNEYIAQTHTIGRPRGSAEKNDSFFSICLSYTFRLPDGLKCFK